LGQFGRLTIALARFPTLILVYLHMAFFALCWGLAGFDWLTLAYLTAAVIAMTCCYINATAINDLTDQATDAINLAGDPERPLVAGLLPAPAAVGPDQATPNQADTSQAAIKTQMWIVAVAAQLAAIASALAISPWAALATGAMLILNAAYSLPPVRIAGRGAWAQALLPLEYCAFPAILSALAVSNATTRQSAATGPATTGLGTTIPDSPDLTAYLLMVASMYVIFVGRVFLKDIRDEPGDRATGKLTFTVRHGRQAAIICSGAATVAGTTALSVVMFLYYDANPGFVFGFCVLSLAGQLTALVQANRAPTTAEAVLYGGVYGRWISMKIFFYLMLIILARSDTPQLVEAIVLGGTALVVLSNVAMLYFNIARQRVISRSARPAPGSAAQSDYPGRAG
jgi:4-hydroxybenzoate polyprenyltransferase